MLPGHLRASKANGGLRTGCRSGGSVPNVNGNRDPCDPDATHAGRVPDPALT